MTQETKNYEVPVYTLDDNVLKVLEQINKLTQAYSEEQVYSGELYQKRRQVLNSYLSYLLDAYREFQKKHKQVKYDFKLHQAKRSAQIKATLSKPILRADIDAILMEEERQNEMTLILVWDFTEELFQNKVKEVQEYTNTCASGLQYALKEQFGTNKTH